MQFPTRKQKIFIALTAYIVAVIFSINLLVLKRDALQFHTRDYNYFVEQAARLTDPRLAKSFALQIEGFNLLGLQGIEGVKSLYHAIHAEYFRYLYVLLYAIFRDPLALYILFCLFFFLPILYFAFLPLPDDAEHTLQWSLFSLLYLTFPATLNSVSADLRPRVLFAAAWCLVVLAIQFNRPFWEKLLFFVLLIAIREEGIFLGAVVIALNYLKMRGRPGRLVQTFVLLLIDLAALLAFLIFMRWGGYARVDEAFNPLSYIRAFFGRYFIFILISAALLVILLWCAWKKNRRQFPNIVFLLCYALAIALTGFHWLRDTAGRYDVQSQASSASGYDRLILAVTDFPTALVFYLLILLVVILWDFTRGRWRSLLIAVYGILVVGSAAITLTYYPPRLSEWRENVAPARLVWNFVAAHDRYETKVLLDYDTYQAFYNYDQVIVYNRLPLWDTLPENRFYPQNKGGVVKQIQAGMDYAVISRESLENVLELSEMAGVLTRELASNDRYVVLKFLDTN